MTATSYHNHTTWSDGSATVPEMVEAARQTDLEEFGISDHYALAPGDLRLSWSLPPESLDDYVEEVQQSIRSTKDTIIRLGLEVDYFPQTFEQLATRLARYSFDYLIGSVHFVDQFPVDLDAKTWEGLSQDSRDQIWRGYWQRLRATAQSGLFDILGHFDLPKKYGFRSSVDLNGEALAVLDAAAAADMAIEINTSGWDRPAGEAYPGLFYLREARRRQIPIVINSDAHSPGELTRHFDRARTLAAEAGYTELVRFERRRRFARPL